MIVDPDRRALIADNFSARSREVQGCRTRWPTETPDGDARREELEARNAGLRSQIDSMLSDLRRRTAQLGEKRDEAAQRTTEVTSRDGLVTVSVDAVGTVRELTLAAKAFERTTPERLGHTITSVLREAAGRAQQGLQETFGPTTEEEPEIADVVSGAPEFKDLARLCGAAGSAA